MKAVILTGGVGSRLMPYTTVLPKPLMPIGHVPILDILIRQLVGYGFDDITLSVGYLAEIIMAYCGDGRKYGLKLAYSKEEKPLGTVGPLSLVPDLNETFFLINGDILTTLDYSRMLAFHKTHGGIMTLAVCQRTLDINFGVVDQMQDHCVTHYTEKPTLSLQVGMGICVMEPQILQHIPPGKHTDIPDLLRSLFQKSLKVGGYVSEDYWMDIGRHDDYEQAIRDFEKIKPRLFPRPQVKEPVQAAGRGSSQPRRSPRAVLMRPQQAHEPER